MADSTDVILQLSRKQWSSALQAKDRMASLANALVIAAAILQGFIVLRGFDPPALAAAALMIGLGVYGGLSARRHGQRFRLEMERFAKLAGRLDELAPDAGLVALEQGPIADQGHGLWPAAVVHLGLVSLGLVNMALVALL
ncbi:MAG: hypothetical protein ACYSUA_05850 [Planctomycetota bacterium]|jgi:hypothetical protein